MDEADSFRKLKMEYPELEEGVVHEALINNDYDLKRASEALRVRCIASRPTVCAELQVSV